MKRILLADNQFITREGLNSLISRSSDVAVQVVSFKRDLIQELIHKPDSYVILDYSLFDFASIDELLILNQRFHQTKWLLFSDELSNDFIRQVYFSALNCSILYKECSENEILAALDEFFNDRRYICSTVSNSLLNNLYRQTNEKSKASLTVTEEQILVDIAKGKTTKEIAYERNISTHTVVSHRKNIFRKIEVNNVHEATKYAVRAGLIDLSDYYI